MKSWKTRWYGRIQKLLARLGLRLPGKIMYIGGRRNSSAAWMRGTRG